MGTAGPLALLLHGQPGGSFDWESVVTRLDGAVPTLAIDRPGWRGAGAARDLAGNARAALSALDACGARRAVVAGHSFGAAVAAWLAATQPERVAALVLVAPAANVESLFAIDRLLALPLAGEALSAATLAPAGIAMSSRLCSRPLARVSGLPERYLIAIARTVRRPSAWLANAREQRALVRDLPALERLLPAISAPTTIVAGAEDRIVPPRAVRRLAEQIPSARLRFSAHAGHLLPQRDPNPVADAILAAAASA